MKIEDKLTESILNGIKTLYNQEVPAKMVQLQKTKKEFEGHLTLVVFPFLKMSKKGPEQTRCDVPGGIVVVMDGEAEQLAALLRDAHRDAGGRVEDARPGEGRHLLRHVCLVEGEIAGPEFAPGRFIAFERIADDEGHGQASALDWKCMGPPRGSC